MAESALLGGRKGFFMTCLAPGFRCASHRHKPDAGPATPKALAGCLLSRRGVLLATRAAARFALPGYSTRCSTKLVKPAFPETLVWDHPGLHPMDTQAHCSRHWAEAFSRRVAKLICHGELSIWWPIPICIAPLRCSVKSGDHAS